MAGTQLDDGGYHLRQSGQTVGWLYAFDGNEYWCIILRVDDSIDPRTVEQGRAEEWDPPRPAGSRDLHDKGNDEELTIVPDNALHYGTGAHNERLEIFKSVRKFDSDGIRLSVHMSKK